MSTASGRRAELLKRLELAGRLQGVASVLFHSAVAAKVGINASDLRCLSLLDASGPMTAGELADATGLTAASITSLIDRLEAGGFAKRQRDDGDRRRILVVPIPSAGKRIGRHFVSYSAAWHELLSSMTDDELEVIERFLARATALTRRETEKLRA
jgi:DNA-binding MarR family transcriptional regulator